MRSFFASAGVVLLVNMITFGLVFWELDSGGPVARALPKASREAPDFQFPQTRNPQARSTGVGAGVERLPLRRADELGRVQPHGCDAADPSGEAVHGGRGVALVSAVTVLVVAARAVNILGA